MPIRHRLSRRAQLAGGQPISQLMARALAQPELISLAAGFVDEETLPTAAVAEAFQSLMEHPGRARAALQYGSTPGYGPLRETILARLRAADGNPASERDLTIEQVIVAAGSNQLLHLLVESLCDADDIVLCAAPTYFVFLGLLANFGIRSVGVVTDEQGPIPAAIDEELARREQAGELDRVKAIYVSSYYDNPAGTTVPWERRRQIVEIARRWSHDVKIHVIEDAAYRLLRYEGHDVPSMRAVDEAGDTVILTDTFSKSFAPGLRVGWCVLPPHLVDPVASQKGNIDFGSPNFSQHLMAEAIERGLVEPQVARVRANYRQKRDAMLAACEKYLSSMPGVSWLRPAGGLYVWLRLPESVDAGPDGTLIERALAEGVLYVPGQYFYPSAGVPAQRNTIRLSFGVQSRENITRGIEALARAIAKG